MYLSISALVNCALWLYYLNVAKLSIEHYVCNVTTSILLLPPSLPEQEIFHQIGEQGQLFSQKDYTNALTLLSHSQPGFDELKLRSRLQELDDIFSGDTVWVETLCTNVFM